MLVRLVKMTFKEERAGDFEELLKTIRPKIRNFPGCLHLDILRDLRRPHIFFSYSRWEGEEDLENYRQSEFFAQTWPRVSKWFSERPEAWSTEEI